MASPAPFTYSATLAYPPDEGVSACEIPITLSAYFSNSASFLYELSGAGTQDVDFGSITPNGAKMVQIEVDADASPAAQPVQVTFNGGTDQIEISPGGFLSYGSPSPTAAGILSMSIAHAADVTVRVRVLG